MNARAHPPGRHRQWPCSFLLLVPVSLAVLALGACSMSVQEATRLKPPASPSAKFALKWPPWQPARPAELPATDHPFAPFFIETGDAHVITYGKRPDGSEHFVVKSRRTDNCPRGLKALRQCFLPESVFAGPSPLQTNTNTLFSENCKWFYPAYEFRSTFFDLLPALTPQAKGLLFYHTSIMLLSVAEEKIVTAFRRRGWHVVVAQPPDSLFRTRLPVRSSTDGTIAGAADLVARDMDRHYLEQAHTTRVALHYLSRTRPSWLKGPRVLMGTSAGTFAMPVEVLMNPTWDALVFVSGGTNLLSLYESESTGLFRDTLRWIGQFRKKPPHGVSSIFSNAEYHDIYRRAADLTRFHGGALAPRIRHYPTLMIAGTIDHIIPEDQALGLHRALGSPERWTTPLGHHLIAIRVIFEVDRIDRWLDTSISKATRE